MSLPKPGKKLIAEAMSMSISSWEDRLRTVEECIGLSVCTTNDWAYMIGTRRFPIGGEACPLCVLFHSYYPPMSEKVCTLCPVRFVTGMSECRSTPYNMVLKALYEYANDNKPADQVLCETVKLEVAFLKEVFRKWGEGNVK